MIALEAFALRVAVDLPTGCGRHAIHELDVGRYGHHREEFGGVPLHGSLSDGFAIAGENRRDDVLWLFDRHRSDDRGQDTVARRDVSPRGALGYTAMEMNGRWALYHLAAPWTNPRFLIDRARGVGWEPEYHFEEGQT